MSSYKEVERELEKIDDLIYELTEKKRQLRKVLAKFKLPHYCPFCGSENIVKGPIVMPPSDLDKYYYCRDCDRGFRLWVMSKRKKEIMKEALKGKEK